MKIDKNSNLQQYNGVPGFHNLENNTIEPNESQNYIISSLALLFITSLTLPLSYKSHIDYFAKCLYFFFMVF